MKLSEKLQIVANWLTDSKNDLLVSAEQDDACLSIVATALVKAATALEEGAKDCSVVEPSGSVLTPEALDEMAAVAAAFDQSDDELLKKQASVLDEILLTLAAPKDSKFAVKKAEDDRIEELKKKYQNIKKDHDEMNKVSDSLKELKKSPVYKEYRPLEFPLSTHTCIEHAGTPLARVGENTYQCCLDGKIYNYESGFTLLDGSKVPGGSVDLQTAKYQAPTHVMFQTREERLK